MSLPHVLRNYTHFQRMVDLILDEPGSTDTHLHERATASLQVFDEPGCLIFNESVRVTPDCLGESKFSSKHLIEAFYHTAQDLNLANGSRYILASVCACARVADAAAQGVGTESPTSGLLHSEVLARELQALAQDIWLMHLGTLQQFLDSSVSPSEALREQLLKRDTYTCFKTGAVDIETQITDTLDAPRSYKDRPTFRKRHVPAPICQGDLVKGRTNPDQTIVDQQTLDFLERYLEITDICTVLDSPCNNLLLHPFAARQFTSYRWTLKPTPIPNQYQVIDHTESRLLAMGARNGEYVTLSDHSQRDNDQSHMDSLDEHDAIQLPRRDNLMLHAAYTSILHRSGISGWYTREGGSKFALMDRYLDVDGIAG